MAGSASPAPSASHDDEKPAARIVAARITATSVDAGVGGVLDVAAADGDDAKGRLIFFMRPVQRPHAPLALRAAFGAGPAQARRRAR